MKIALVYGGQPRFTYDFIDLMKRLKGFDSADIYMVLWKSDWAQTEEQARQRIQKVLLPGYSIGKITVIDEPPCEYPPGAEKLSPPAPENAAWWYSRMYKHALGIAWAFDLIEQKYDAVIRFRGDGSVDRELDVSKLELNKTPLLFPNNAGSGFDDYKLNDQLVIGTHEMMKFYCDKGKQFKELIPQSDPNWNISDTINGATWTWCTEHVIGYYLKKCNIVLNYGDFGVVLNSYGRSRFTDKHYHHGIASDPTE